MKKLLLAFSMLLLFNGSHASHVVGGEIGIKYLYNTSYRLELILLTDPLGASVSSSTFVVVKSRSSLISFTTWQVFLSDIDTLTPSAPGCDNLPHNYYKLTYSDTISLDSFNYDDPAGYLFEWSSCCRTSSITNVTNSSVANSQIVTFFSTVDPNTGRYLFNSTPDLNDQMPYICHGKNFNFDFGGNDIDGDSMYFSIMSPLEGFAGGPGTVSPLYSPYPDPKTLYHSINWANCYDKENQINGYSNPNCNSLNEPDRLQISPANGIVYGKPGGPVPGKFLTGFSCVEIRNGSVISEVMRDVMFTMIVCSNPANYPPIIDPPKLQSFASWSADTIVFSASPVCIQINATDPDTVISDIFLSTLNNEYGSDEIYFLQNQAQILPGDTFNTALCFEPDSFSINSSAVEIIASNPGCYDLARDTLKVFFRFNGFSNAGWGGNLTIPMTSFAGSIDLFALLSGNPNSGGIWYDLDSNNHMNPNGFLEWKYVTQPKTYRFIYVQQEPNYPADTAHLTLNFVRPVELENELENEVLIYPNPAKGFVLIECQRQMLGARFSVRNILGQIEKTGILNNRKVTISIGELNPGFYSVYIEKGADSQLHTIIVQ
jgi:hypothetical protein